MVKIRKIIKVIILPITLLLASIYLYYFTDLPDQISNLNYQPPIEISRIIEKVDFTDHGATIFKATKPTLNNREEFNQNCSSHNDAISILGCYTNDRIYVYNIDANSNGLDGIIESVSVHEMLHAAWHRLHSWEKSSLSDALTEVYSSNKELLGSEMSIYEDSDRLDELHARIGTEIKNLPESLESHYAKYFKDQDKVVEFYDKYNAPFIKLSQEAKELSEEINSMKKKIDSATEKYYRSVEDLNSRISEFNRCANTTGCLSSHYEANRRRYLLLSEQSDLESVNTTLNEEISKYNNLINQYNSNILRSQTLENVINSNIPSTKIK